MLLAVVISFVLLVLIAGTLLLAKTRKDNLGGIFCFVSWFVIVSSFALIVFAISAHICKRMMCHKMCNERGFMPGPGGMMMGRGHDGCCAGWDGKEMGMCCKDKEKMGCEGKDMNKMGCGGEMGKMKCGGDMSKMSPEQKADDKIKMLTEKLKLTSEQVPKVKEIYVQCFKACDDNMKMAGGDKGKCDQMCEKSCKEKMDALKKVLTAEQFKNLPPCCMK